MKCNISFKQLYNFQQSSLPAYYYNQNLFGQLQNCLPTAAAERSFRMLKLTLPKTIGAKVSCVTTTYIIRLPSFDCWVSSNKSTTKSVKLNCSTKATPLSLSLLSGQFLITVFGCLVTRYQFLGYSLVALIINDIIDTMNISQPVVKSRGKDGSLLIRRREWKAFSYS